MLSSQRSAAPMGRAYRGAFASRRYVPWPLVRGGLCGCEQTGQHLPWHDKARTLRAGRAGLMLQEIPYRFLLNLSNFILRILDAGTASFLSL